MTTVRALVVRDLIRRHPALTALSVAGSLTATACQLAVPAALARAVDSMSGRGPTTGPVALVATLLLVGLAGSVAASQATAYRAATTTARHRTEQLDRSMRLPVHGDLFPPGELITRFSTDAEAPGWVGTASLSMVLTAGTGVVALVALWLIDWPLAALVVLELAVSWLAVRVFLRRSGDAETRYRAARGQLAALLVDAHNGIRTIRACRARDREERRILAPLVELRAAGRAWWRSQRDVSWQLGLLAPAREVAILVAAGLGVVSGRLTAGELLAVLVYSQLALGVLEQVDTLLGVVQGTASCRRLIEVLDAAVTPVPAVPRRLPAGGRGEIRFEQVALSNHGEPVLAGVTFTVPAGAHVAVVGRSGAGKSMLVALLGRLVDADAGRVLLDGVDVRAVEPAALRREVAYAFEEPHLFGATLGDAIAATAPLSQADVLRTARLARADGFVRRLPRGYATPVDRAPLSGGERQRVGLARALARPARVLVLDDAMSSLDTATAAEVAHATRTSWRTRTALIVAHRAATAAGADAVAWLEDGRLRALAPHGELWRDSRYRAVFTTATPEPDAPFGQQR
jgi:ATP-binding cassette subfamily B protein